MTTDDRALLRMAYAVLAEIAAAAPQDYPGVNELARVWCEMYRALRDKSSSAVTPTETPRAKRRLA